jgi:hypothetical protein
MTGKDEASADGILRPPRVAFLSFSTVKFDKFDTHQPSLRRVGQHELCLQSWLPTSHPCHPNQLMYMYIIYILGVVVGVRCRDLREGGREGRRERTSERERE